VKVVERGVGVADKMTPGRKTPIRANHHPADSRTNIPTAELESFARPGEKRPTIVRYTGTYLT
jgi:hypothetical protein